MTNEHPFRTAVPFAELSRWSPWVGRLNGSEPFSTEPRTLKKIEREYNAEKYAACLDFASAHPRTTPGDIKRAELGDLGREICVSVGEELFSTTVGEAQRYGDAAFLAHIAPYMAEADVVCDLGCGYGYHLSLLRERFPGKRYIGGEYASRGVQIAAKLFPEGGVSVTQFDFTDPAFTLPVSKNDRAIIFTMYAIEQLPEGAGALARLAALKADTWRICHFEPVFGWCSETPLGKLRSAYTVANDYNRDLLPFLESRGIRIDDIDKEYFGMNPLHPVSFLSWR